jgi:hypothetical protein
VLLLQHPGKIGDRLPMWGHWPQPPLLVGNTTMMRIVSRPEAVHPTTFWTAASIVAFVLTLGASTMARAQNLEINDLKGKIFDAKMAQQTFGKGIAHCGELDGTNFYFRQRDRILNLEEYHRSLESLAQQRAFNPETRRPWNEEDAIARWDLVQKEAADDRRNCALIAHLSEMEKKLDELQKQAAAPAKP